jgi:hypothetical protein
VLADPVALTISILGVLPICSNRNVPPFVELPVKCSNASASVSEPIRTRSDVLTDAKVVYIAGFLHKLFIVEPMILIPLPATRVACFPSNAPCNPDTSPIICV